MHSTPENLLSKEDQDLLSLIEKVNKILYWEIRNQKIRKAKLHKKKIKKKKKYLKKSFKKSEKKRMRLHYVPLLVSQAIMKGIPLREPKTKKGSRQEPDSLLYDQKDKFQPLTDFTEFIESSKLLENKIPIGDFNFKSEVNLLERIYLQRIDDRNDSILVKLFVDWGYTRKNRLSLFIDEDNNELAICVIHLLDDKGNSIEAFPLKHRSFYIKDEEPSANSLFIGLITNLQPDTHYKYRIECYKKSDKTLFAASRIKEFRTSFNLSEKNKPLFFTLSSDLHGGRKGRFLRGKLQKKDVRGNKDLGRVFSSIASTENLVTFNEGYSLSIATGDLTENASYSEYWADLFKQCYKLWDHVPLVTSLGNHDYYTGGRGKGNKLGGLEEDCRYWHRFITNPTTGGGTLPGHWYSFDQGNAHLVFIDSNGTGWGKFELSCDSQQWYWLENDLRTWREKVDRGENVPQFCFVFLHSAIMSTGFWGRGFNWGNDEKAQSYLTPLFRKYGINMVIFGHDHIYQRTSWMNTTYLANGRNGGTLRPDLPFLRKRVSFDIHRTCSNRHTRIYTTLLVPPNINSMSEKEKNDFNDFKLSLKNKLLSEPTASFYFFGLRHVNQRLGRAFDKNKKLKEQLIDKFILPKIDDHIWLRAYAIEPLYQANRREIFDSCFIGLRTKEMLERENYQMVCPEKVVD